MTGGTDGNGELFDVAPFVLVVDRSESMKGVMPRINSFVPELIETMREVPEALESAALGIISFNERAQVVRRLTWLDEELTRPEFRAGGRTSYVEPLQCAQAMIERDTPQLGERGFTPVVFFITDANPNVGREADWLAARAELLGSPLCPKLVTFGFGEVTMSTLERLASEPGLVEINTQAAHTAMSEILKVVLHTVITLTSSAERPPDGSLASRILRSEADRDEDTIAYVW